MMMVTTDYTTQNNQPTQSKTQIDPSGLSAKTAGAKLDANKTPLFDGLIDYFPRACLAVADISKYGANKYSWKGWEKVKDGPKRYMNALLRHAAKLSIEGELDNEALADENNPTEILHRAQIAWNALASLELYLQEQEKLPLA